LFGFSPDYKKRGARSLGFLLLERMIPALFSGDALARNQRLCKAAAPAAIRPFLARSVVPDPWMLSASFSVEACQDKRKHLQYSFLPQWY
jgi:hypothetical protein